MADRDEPCPRCGYNLRMLAGDRCPECGDALVLRVGLAEPRMAGSMALVAACCLGAGGSALFIAVAVSAAPRDCWQDTPAAWALLAMLAVARRRAVMRWSPRRWAWLAGLAWAVLAALSAAVVLDFE